MKRKKYRDGIEMAASIEEIQKQIAPGGPLVKDNPGAMGLAILDSPDKKSVVVLLGMETSFLGFTPAHALVFADAIRAKALELIQASN